MLRHLKLHSLPLISLSLARKMHLKHCRANSRPNSVDDNGLNSLVISNRFREARNTSKSSDRNQAFILYLSNAECFYPKLVFVFTLYSIKGGINKLIPFPNSINLIIARTKNWTHWEEMGSSERQRNSGKRVSNWMMGIVAIPDLFIFEQT